MAIWIQSLSWALVYAVGQGMVVFALLWFVLKLLPATAANVKYHMCLLGLTLLLVWFGITWWQQYHALQQEWALLQALPVGTQNGGNTLYALMQLAAPWLCIGYLAGLFGMLLRFSGGMWQLFSLRSNGISQAGDTIITLLDTLKHKLDIDKRVQLFISAKAQVPMVIGYLKPMILVPAAAIAQLTPAQLESILLHELAHIKRNDYFINILQTIAETILFFNPFVWMISRIIRREREYSCDDMVLQHIGEPHTYATALATLAIYPATVPLAMAASGTSHPLFNRIKRIMEMKKNPFSYSKMVATIFMLAIIAGAAIWFTPSFAGSKEKTAAAPASPRSVATEEQQLVSMLSADHLVDEIKGFVVQRNNDDLFIDGKRQPQAIANKYLSGLQKEQIRIVVLPFKQRLQNHPGSSIMQLIMPMTFSSPCVDTNTSKPGC